MTQGIRLLIRAASEATGVSEADIVGKTHCRRPSEVRHTLMRLVGVHYRAPAGHIAAQFNRHRTALHYSMGWKAGHPPPIDFDLYAHLEPMARSLLAKEVYFSLQRHVKKRAPDPEEVWSERMGSEVFV